MIQEYSLSDDLAECDWILAKVKDDSYAQNLYAAMCNMQWQKAEVWPVLKDELWSVTWRSAGGIVAELRGEGDYINWYCSGIGADESCTGFVQESVVTDEIRRDLATLGWHPVPYLEDDR